MELKLSLVRVEVSAVDVVAQAVKWVGVRTDIKRLLGLALAERRVDERDGRSYGSLVEQLGRDVV